MARVGGIPSAAKVGRERRFPAGACDAVPAPVSTLLVRPARGTRQVELARDSIAAIRGW